MENITLGFWDRVNKELKAQGKTQVEMCRDCEFSLNSIRARISQNNAPNVYDSFKIAKYLNVPLEYLVAGSMPSTSAGLDTIKAKLKEIQGLISDILKE